MCIGAWMPDGGLALNTGDRAFVNIPAGRNLTRSMRYDGSEAGSGLPGELLVSSCISFLGVHWLDRL